MSAVVSVNSPTFKDWMPTQELLDREAWAGAKITIKIMADRVAELVTSIYSEDLVDSNLILIYKYMTVLVLSIGMESTVRIAVYVQSKTGHYPAMALTIARELVHRE